MNRSLLFLFLLIPCVIFGKKIDTFYGPIHVKEPVLFELIESEPMQRLKDVCQYGVSYYTTHQDPYNRYDHSLGVFAILRWKGASLGEQIAGLLHDVSHTVFSHVGDWIFDYIEEKNSYQDSVHHVFLEKYGLSDILEKHGFKMEDVLHKSGKFRMLECDLPDLCADRIDYNLQGAFHQGFMTKKETRKLLKNLRFDGQKWVSTQPKLMKKMVAFSLYMTRHCWGSPENYVASTFLSNALKNALDQGHISKDDICYGKDEEVYSKLLTISEPLVKMWMERLHQIDQYYSHVPARRADTHAIMKFRGIDPWIKKGKRYKRLSQLDKALFFEYMRIKTEMEVGWSLMIH